MPFSKKIHVPRLSLVASDLTTMEYGIDGRESTKLNGEWLTNSQYRQALLAGGPSLHLGREQSQVELFVEFFRHRDPNQQIARV